MQTPNRDLFATDLTQEQYRDIEPLIVSPLLDEQFKKHERAATKAKRRYHYLGQTAIVLVAASAIFTVAEVLILPDFLNNVYLKFVAVIMAGLGIILQCYLIFTKQKQKWLLNRFAAERLRSLKFQIYLMAVQAKDSEDLKQITEAYVKKRLAKLENELNGGVAVLGSFTPKNIMDELPTETTPKNKPLAKLAHEAYLELRVQYQRSFALSEVKNFTGRRRLFNSTQDMIYLGAAVFAFISLGAKIAQQKGMNIDTGWIDFIAITLFVLGATEAIMDNALLEEQSQARFEQYIKEIEDVAIVTEPDGNKLKQIVNDMERICLDELDSFCRAADRIHYRF